MTQALFDAIKGGDLARVRDLLHEDPSLANARSKAGTHAAVLALYFGRDDISEAIVSAGAVLDLPSAAAVGRLDRVMELVRTDPGSVDAVSGDGNTALGLASYLGHVDVVGFLLSNGADVNYADPKTGFTALTGAISSGHADIVETLLEGGADPDHRYEAGNTPLTEAAFGGDLRILRALLAHRADITARNDKGQTALAVALERGHGGAAKLLREHGATG